MTTERNFNTISPSARVLLLMKALTDIPYARETAALILDPEAFDRLIRQQHSLTFLMRVVHFENRYKSIDQMLDVVQPTNVLELSSGFSCRGLDMTRQKQVVYLDTDLPDSATSKKGLITDLIRIHHIHRRGKLYVQPLNAMDERQFENALLYFPPGPVTIVNEGLLVYLNDEEKRSLCKTIHAILKRRGGQWITGDIYLKNPDHEPAALKAASNGASGNLQAASSNGITNGNGYLAGDQPAVDNTGSNSSSHAGNTYHSNPDDLKWQEFLQEHNVNDNKFNDYSEAETFFNSCGFHLSLQAPTRYETISALNHFSQTVTHEMIDQWLQYRRTWILEAE